MRVIAGEFRSRRLKAPPGLETRPTPDRLREALFNVLAPRIEGSVFVDAYAGSGSVGIEALSRGARRAVFIESHRGAAEIVKENLAALGIERQRFEVRKARATGALQGLAADIVFLDPPYPLVNEYDAALTILATGTVSLVIAQHHSRHALAETFGHLARCKVVKQGDNTLSFYELTGV